jgi:quinoprotein glucose dehydrogenase
LLKDLKLPPLGDNGRPFVLTTRTLLLVAHAASPPRLYAFDKSSGKEIMRKDLAASPSGSLMTYMVGQKQYISIPVGGRSGAGLLTLALPD